MINIAICDDDPAVLGEMVMRISRFRPDYAVEAFGSGGALLKSKKRFDMVFLDIEMPGTDGMETAKQLHDRRGGVYIIFLTSHTEYMREAFKVRAYRYLVKPVRESELYESILQAEKELLEKKKVASTVDAETTLIALDHIVCIEAYGDRALIHTVDGTVISNRSLKHWAETLGGGRFFRVHKSYLVAFAHIERFDRSGVTVAHMDDLIPVSRRNASAFKDAFAEYIRKYASYV